jgi:hypothetical protein
VVALLIGDHAQQVQRFRMAQLNHLVSLVEPGRFFEVPRLMLLQGLAKAVSHDGFSTARPR